VPEGLAAMTPPMHLRAAAGGAAIDLLLAATKPPTLEGDRGLSRKGAQPGDASYYYSVTRMASRGTLRLPEGSFAVAGLSWMDREWSTSALSGEQVGWDWFALQLDDGRELMLYRLRLRGGGDDAASGGTLIGRDGEALALHRADWTLRASELWVSPKSGARYPALWHLEVPGGGLDLTVRPLAADQELNLSFQYWEGAVEVSGVAAGGRPVHGRGYVELTGYAAEPAAGAAPPADRVDRDGGARR
nr:carotenoid 1,2-hydratase [Acidobacteriota bacterium]